MIDNLSVVQFASHVASVNVNEFTDQIYVFKHNNKDKCNFEIFDSYSTEAELYIQSPVM
jgi:hypothetical protein